MNVSQDSCSSERDLRAAIMSPGDRKEDARHAWDAEEQAGARDQRAMDTAAFRTTRLLAPTGRAGCRTVLPKHWSALTSPAGRRAQMLPAHAIQTGSQRARTRGGSLRALQQILLPTPADGNNGRSDGRGCSRAAPGRQGSKAAMPAGASGVTRNWCRLPEPVSHRSTGLEESLPQAGPATFGFPAKTPAA